MLWAQSRLLCVCLLPGSCSMGGMNLSPCWGGLVGKVPCLPQLLCAGLHKAARAEFPVPGRCDAAQQSLVSCWLTPCLDRQEPRAACQLPGCAHCRHLAADWGCAPSMWAGVVGVGHTGVLLPEKVSVRACVDRMQSWAVVKPECCLGQDLYPRNAAACHWHKLCWAWRASACVHVGRGSE